MLQPATRLVARHRDNHAVRAIATFARRYLDSFENLDYDVEYNGERRVLETFGRIGTKCVFDVGANVGNWALCARQAIPSAEIHCFELVPATAAELRRNTNGDDGIVVNGFGLSDRVASVDVRYFPGQSALSSTVAYSHALDFVTVRGNVDTGDAYLERCGIEHVDLLKIDVEGAEGAVLEGFSAALSAGRIRAVQFEYGRANVVTRCLLKDHYERFEPLGYRVGKIYPTKVDFRGYRYEDEDFRGPNYLAVADSATELIAALAE